MNDQLDQRVRNALVDIMDTAPPPADSPMGNVSLERPPKHHTSRRLVIGAATIAIIGGGIAALGIEQSGSTNDAESPSADTQSATTASATTASESVAPPSAVEPPVTPVAPAPVEATADEQERLRALEVAGESLGLKPTRMQVLIMGGERRALDGVLEDESGDLSVAFTISPGSSPPPVDGRFKRTSAGYQYRFHPPYLADVRRFDDAEDEFVSLRISVGMRSGLELDEQTVHEIAETLLAVI